MKLAMLISLLSVTLASTIVSTVCWFVGITNVDYGVGGISVLNAGDVDNFTISHRALKFNDSTKQGEVTSKTGASVLTCKLDAYDHFLPERNSYLSQIVEITLDATQGNNKSTNLYVDIPCMENFVSRTSNVKVGAFMSNVCRIRGCLYSYTIVGSSTVHTAFTMGTANRYKKEIDPSSTATYSNNDDKIYQEVRYHLTTNTKYAFTTYVSESSVSALPASTDPTFETKMLAINSAKPKTIRVTIPAEVGSFTLPANYSKVVFYLEIDYSTILTNFFANNQNATVYEGSALSVADDFTAMKIGIDS